MNETPKTKSGWRNPRRVLISLAVLATLIAIFYAEEDWRGKRAWENCKRELEAKRMVLDWDRFIPPPVPDEQNVFKAPEMTEWFVRGPWFDSFRDDKAKPPKEIAPFAARQGSNPGDKDVLVAEVDVVAPAPASGPEHGGEVLRFEDPAAGDQAAKLLAARVGTVNSDGDPAWAKEFHDCRRTAAGRPGDISDIRRIVDRIEVEGSHQTVCYLVRKTAEA